MSSVAQLVRKRFGELTPVQKLAIPKVLSGQNVIILAPTGSGKTECALLPVLEKIMGEEAGICALYITPLRALSRDLKQRFNWWCERLDISHDIRTGDTTQHTRTKHRKNPPKILLTTVESLQALLMGRVMRRHLANIKFVIIDEVHDVLDNKRGAQLSMGLERLNLIADFQRIAISATVADENEAARLAFGDREYAVCQSGKNRKMDIKVENILSKEKSVERIKMLVEKNRSLVFVNTRSTAEELGASLKKARAPVAVHHGSLSKGVRLGTEDKFKNGEVNSILCTSSLELGIDVGDVSLAVQYGSPHQVFRLIQRIGRSGHSMDKVPRGVIFSSDFDDMLESTVLRIFAENGWIENKKAERGALDVIAHQLVGLCMDFGRMPLSRTHKILSRSYAYSISYEQLRKVALQLYSEGILYYDETPDNIFIKLKSRARQYYYTFLSTIPRTKRFLMKDISSNKVISSLDEEFVVNLETGASFLSQGMPWHVVDITGDAVLAESTSGSDIMVPSWTGEDIPVSFEVAQEVGKMRGMRKDVSLVPDDRTIIIEMVEDLVIVHACLGSRVNEALARMYSKKLSRLAGESVWAVSDPYRIIVKLPFPLQEKHLKEALTGISSVRKQLEDAIEHSPLLRFKFMHVGRMFGLLSEDAGVNSRFIHAMKYSAVYEETVRSIFFRYFDVEKTEEILDKVRKNEIGLLVDKRDKPSYFARVGLDRISGGESVGMFEPRERIISAFKENVLSKTLHLKCLNCGATRFLHLAGAPEKISCHKCGQGGYAPLDRQGKLKDEAEFSAGLIRNYGKQALVALSTYGIGPSTADRVLRRLHKDEESFYVDLIDAQKSFIKNKKYWKF
ncbi:DEAD/DEAH box helicase [Candidatus Micrarchaeota archaeon]|nr:DEAD/DEAH box helicase [Candidatus Micrarchaeota archaeon]